jgi:hypothetical protein
MNKIVKTLLVCSFIFQYQNSLIAQIQYIKALGIFENNLIETEQISFEQAVFLVENAYYDNLLDSFYYDNQLTLLEDLSLIVSKNNLINYDYEDVAKISLAASIFKVMTDSIKISNSDFLTYNLPHQYDFDDIFGDKNWSQMFVSKLLSTRKGNCHSLPYLYKILAHRLGIEAHLALAPNHIYIKQFSQKAGWYNTELTSVSFPVDAWLMASGYVHLDAIRNGVYMKALTDKESIALCVIDLAIGYDKKYSNNDGSFIIECCDLALQYFPNYINALLLKAETHKKQFELVMKELGVRHPQEVFNIPKAKKTFEEMQKTYANIHQLGYRQMPKQMYLEWLISLNEEKEKYNNKKIDVIQQNK